MRRRSNRPKAKRRKALCGHTHAHRIARLLVREQQLVAKAAQLRHAIDRALVLARSDSVPHAEVASEYISLAGCAATADEHDRVVGRLRQRTAVAASRTGARAADGPGVAERDHQHQHGRQENNAMPHDPYLRRRVIEEYGPPPGGAEPPHDEDLGEPDDLNGPDTDEGDDHDLDGDDDE